MNDRLLHRREVERLTGLSRASIYRLEGDGRFPRAVRVAYKGVRWRESDITTWSDPRLTLHLDQFSGRRSFPMSLLHSPGLFAVEALRRA